ncbi:MAG: DNA/RNA non-specific endonuclease [Tissierellia bacterium]|nr:DNA/RNA non-specific endonuclease [Tissierellia bacterium]
MLRGIVKGKEKKKNPLEKQSVIQQEALERFKKAMASQGKKGTTKKLSDKVLKSRRRIIDNKDTIALERIMGVNDLVPISYLKIGFEVGKSVCKILIRDKFGKQIGSGTGFLIAPGILMTNNHVIPDIDFAKYSIAEFNYQNDDNFMPCPVSHFKFEPERFFLTDEKLDFSIIAVKEEMVDGKTVNDFGFIKLIADPEKILEGEYVSIIQHPKGEPKAVTVRENKVKFIFDDFIHYMTDTEPGSSGSPVFNDQWIVVALHHSGVPDPNKNDKWIANEGIRISSIASFVNKASNGMSKEEKLIVSKILGTSKKTEETGTNLKNKKGYDKEFLGKDYSVELPQLSKSMKEDVTRKKNGNYVLDYVHFSIVMCKSRGLAYFTGVNIDGNTRVKIKRGEDNWRFDPRISESNQYGNEVYAKNDLDRGHLVRREDPNWGTESVAIQANDDTFHFTNSAPQHKNLNQRIWLGLEDYVLKNASNHALKISVFTGPVFRENDMVYRKKYLIPRDFWKVVVMVKSDGKLSATAYLQTQEDMITGLEFAYGAYETYQVPVSKIAEITGLDFGDLPKYDPISKIESNGLKITNHKNIRL